MISASRYKIIADLINDAQDRGSEITRLIGNMDTYLSESEIPSVSIDRQRLESQIDTTLEVMTDFHQNYANLMKDFVFILQKYIDDNYSSVNDFLSDNSTQVKSVFADISETVGYPIDAENIESIS